MWDLETLHLLNERAVVSSMKAADMVSGQKTTPEPDPVWPLSILAGKLTIGPPSLARLVDLLESSESIGNFIELIREYLPGYEDVIMAQGDDTSRIRCFRDYFEARYFPLQELDAYLDEYSLGDFVMHIPVDLMGFGYDENEDFASRRPGFILMLSIVENPFAVEQRVPILAAVEQLVGKTLTDLIPAKGWDVEEIRQMLDGTEYEGCAKFAEWTHGQTGCLQLDADYENYGPEEWHPGIVEGLTTEWPRVVDIQDKMQGMYVWLEEDLYRNFGKLLGAMLDTKVETTPKEQMPLPLIEVFKEEVANG